MIGQRPQKLTPRQEREAYAACTARDQGRCVRCGWYGTVHRDHRQNRTAYNTTPANLQLLCGPHGDEEGCHKWATEHPEDAMRDGFAVSRWADPTATPAYRYGIGWVLYLDQPDEDGNWWIPVNREERP